MRQAIRPYLTTGVAIVSASAIIAAPTVAPIPPDVTVPTPSVQVSDRGVRLAASVEGVVNSLVYAATQAGVSVTQLTAPIVANVLGIDDDAAKVFLAIGTIGLFGPLISGTGAVGTAIQDVIDSGDLEELLTNLIGAPGTIVGGLVNGNYGPDLAPIILGAGIGVPILAGGLINPGNLPFPVPTLPPYTVPGTIPTLQGLVGQLLGLLPGAAAVQSTPLVSSLAAPDTTVEDAINTVVFQLTKVGVSLAEATAPLVAPILGVSTEQAEYFEALAFVGFAGPLISGTGAFGTALQNILNSHGLDELLVNTIAAPGTVINGAVNGGFGPNLQSLLTILPTTVVLPFPPGSAPVIGVFAPGFINNPGFIYDPSADGVGSLLGGTSLNPTVTLLPPSVTTLLQAVVTTVLGGGLPTGLSANASTLKAADTETPAIADVEGADLGTADGPGLLPNKQRPLVKLNILRANPLAQNKNGSGAVSAASGKHAPGAGKNPVHDLVKRVLGHKGTTGGADGGAGK